MYTSKLAHMASLYAHRVVARRTARGYATHVPLSTESGASYAGLYAHKGLCYTVPPMRGYSESPTVTRCSASICSVDPFQSCTT
jgi:hypothetical protein